MIKKSLLAASFVCVFFSAALPAEEIYTYDSYVTDEQPIRLIVEDGGKVRLGAYDRFSEVEICETSELHCFNSSFFKFSFPKRPEKYDSSWSFGGLSYRRDQAPVDLNFLGQHLAAYRVEAEYAFPSGKGKDQKRTGKQFFIFSEERGLVALGFRGNEQDYGVMYFLTQKCGYAASAYCNEKR